MRIAKTLRELGSVRALRLTVVVLWLLTLLIPGAALAKPLDPPPPELPWYYYGSVMGGGQAVDAGAAISVTVNGLSKPYLKTTTVDGQGNYGYAQGTGVFYVPSDSTSGVYGARPGDVIAFYVKGLRARLFDVKAGQWVETVAYPPYPGQGPRVSQINLVAPPVITATAQSGGTIDPHGRVLVGWNGSQGFKITPDAGHKIKDVKVDNASVGAQQYYTFTQVIANHTIDATFSWLTYTITPTAGVHGKIIPGTPVTVTWGMTQTFTITPDTHYLVADVKVDGASKGVINSYTFAAVKADHTIQATFVGGWWAYLPVVMK